MSQTELAAAAQELADSLESAVPLCTTRMEHIRVSGHATRARRLAQELSDRDQTHYETPAAS